MKLRLGTRGSRLALAQSGHVADDLRALGHEIDVVVIKTRGDVQLSQGLQDNADKGFFTGELEAALISGDIDFVVHSLKDLPTEVADGTRVTATPVRAPAGDVLICHPDAVDPTRPLHLRTGARVGTGAARRMALVAAADPELTAVPIRGNVPTRAAFAARGELEAVVLARAGLVRLGYDLAGLVVFDLVPERWIPAPGQGVLALQCREDDPAEEAIGALLDHLAARDVRYERGVLAAFEGGCHAAVGAWVDRDRDQLLAGADLGDGWGTTAVPLNDDAIATAVANLRAGGTPLHTDLPWVRPAAPWPLV